ncbi:site-specific integrase (plasmid) [Streptomyces sp. NBC_00853]|uniref:tyrosine-type recombinase/integrase n=1 Tax=Streptomyces sp. NBC_00853 TaxID=2903681 RepID=UPI0038735539|nr:site-specific integrase [Streptomyces sp. NBC_00853]
MTTPTTAAVPASRPAECRAAEVPTPVHTGPVNDLPAEDILTLVTAHADRMGYSEERRRELARGTHLILDWLCSHSGDGWQQRWLAAGADAGLEWLGTIPAYSDADEKRRRAVALSGLASLLLNRVVLPSHDVLVAYNSTNLFREARQSVQPDAFARVIQQARDSGMAERRLDEGLKILSKLVLHSGKELDQLSAEDFEDYRHWGLKRLGRIPPGVFPAWDLLRGVDVLPRNIPYKQFLHEGQRPTAELVERYQIRSSRVRDVFVRYLEERRPSLDYGSFTGLISQLVGGFWADIEAHHQDVDSLDLEEEVVVAWKERLKWVKRGSSPRPRKSYLLILVQVRGFYLDIQEWALEDPSWAPHAVPSPVRRGETDGLQKHRRSTMAKMHQRVRDRLPHLPVLVTTAERHLQQQQNLLTIARKTPLGEVFEYHGAPYRRITYKVALKSAKRARPETVLVENLSTGEITDVYVSEDEAFWSWAVIETLRHTGVRREELLEITHLALVSYRLADTDELVPLLQILPSKNNQERLLLVSPELASVLAAIITRQRKANGGAIPLTSRYDRIERTFGPMLPHLFQRKTGHRNEVVAAATVQSFLNNTLARTNLTDAAGEPLKFTAHDFRRMFATEAVTGGLPVHIAARLLGHEDLSTTQAYLAVFQDDLIRSYRTFLDQRRSMRPDAEYREPTDQEWLEFQQHFALRKVELGTCGRPYGTPCKHEHACVRCPMLRVDPQQRMRLIEIARSLAERISEAKLNGWLGEAEGLQVSFEAARKKLTALDRASAPSNTRIADLGIPQIRRP